MMEAREALRPRDDSPPGASAPRSEIATRVSVAWGDRSARRAGDDDEFLSLVRVPRTRVLPPPLRRLDPRRRLRPRRRFHGPRPRRVRGGVRRPPAPPVPGPPAGPDRHAGGGLGPRPRRTEDGAGAGR